MENENATHEVVVGDVEVGGTRYRILRSRENEREVIRRGDGVRVGRLRGSPTVLWRLEAEGIDDELFRTIVRAAIDEGFLPELPTD